MLRIVKILPAALLPWICAAGCNASDTDGASCAQDDETALIQKGLHVRHRHQRISDLESPVHEHPQHHRPPSGNLLLSLAGEGDFDCEEHPRLCEAPFNCHEVSTSDIDRWLKEGVSAKGRPNYKLWCAVPHYEAYASKCVAGDLDGAGRAQFRLTTGGHFGPVTKEMDASACFMDGHCTNSEVTNDTTIDEAVQMCDDRFGREAWSRWGSESMPAQDHLDYSLPADMSTGYEGPEQTRPFMLAGCAMGNYHCDVRYCQETYCKEEYYVQKYGHLLKRYGWAQ